MKKVKCKNCHTISYTDDKYCMFCGTEFDNYEVQKPSNIKITINTFFSMIKIIAVILICAIGIVKEIELLVLIYVTIFIELFIYYLEIVVRERKRKNQRLQVKVSKKVDSHKSRVRRMVIMTTLIFVSLTIVIGYLNTIELPDTRKKERYEFEIEPGYGFVSPISVLEMTSRMNKAISSVTEDYTNLEVVDFYSQFSVSVDINITDDFRDAEYLFRELVDVLYTTDKYYSYLIDFQVHFYHNNEHFYSTRILNIFLTEEVSLNNDGTFYDVKSNTIVFFKTLEDKNFSFEDKKYDENNLDLITKSYVKSFNKWYQNFQQALFKVDDAIGIVNIRFMNRDINPEKTDLLNLEVKINDLNNQCNELKKLEPDFYHVVEYQYSLKGCEYYVRAYMTNLDGLNNRSVKRVEYSYIANNIGYMYIYRRHE